MSSTTEVDYERIWALSTTYYVTDFTMNFLYSTGFPHFILPPWGGETIARQGKGKLILHQDRRESDTADAFWKWFENGPSSMKTKESVEKVLPDPQTSTPEKKRAKAAKQSPVPESVAA